MDDGHQLKSLFQGLEADEVEMARYRTRLAGRLPVRRAGRLRWVLAVAAVLALAWIFGPFGASSLGGHDLDSLQLLAAQPGEKSRLIGSAKEALESGDASERGNAMVVLALTLPAAEGIPLATRGLSQDGRAEYRAFFLEYLMDVADEWQWHTEALDQLIERENDPLCLALFRQLLKIA